MNWYKKAQKTSDYKTFWLLPDGNSVELGTEPHHLFLVKNLNLFGLQKNDLDGVDIKGDLAKAFNLGALRLIWMQSGRENDFVAVGFEKYLNLKISNLIDMAKNLYANTLTTIATNDEGEAINKQIKSLNTLSTAATTMAWYKNNRLCEKINELV